MNRIRAGYCDVPNPFNPKQVSHVSLKSPDVSAIVFWTRDPKPIIKYLPELDSLGYKYYFHYTILGYPANIDPKSPTVDAAVNTFRRLSDIIGKDRVIWRYDPILLSNETPTEWHINKLSMLIDRLKTHTKRLVISFIDPYRKTKIRMDKETGENFHLSPEAFDPSAYYGLAEWLGSAAAEAGLKVFSCAEEADLGKFGIRHGSCVDGALVGRITGADIALRKDPSQRKLCGCVISKDIGVNNTCLFGCRYCYATSSAKAAEDNFRRHDNKSPSLIPAEKGAVG